MIERGPSLPRAGSRATRATDEVKRLATRLAAFALLGFAACTSNPASNDAGTTCLGPLGDAGFSSLIELPVAALCASSAQVMGDEMLEWSCGSWTLVVRGTGPDCGTFWLFDATTGALEALGQGCEGFVCTGAAPGFQFPSECAPGTVEGPPPPINLCAINDAGADVEAGPQAVPDSAAGGG
jgi:hypothetical protein